jgi:hypothetical protein
VPASPAAAEPVYRRKRQTAGDVFRVVLEEAPEISGAFKIAVPCNALSAEHRQLKSTTAHCANRGNFMESSAGHDGVHCRDQTELSCV